MSFPHPKKLAAASMIGALTPFMLGADVDPTGGTDLELTVIKIVIASLVPVCAVGVGVVAKSVGAGLVAVGKRLLGDKNKGNDALGAGLVATGESLGASKSSE